MKDDRRTTRGYVVEESDRVTVYEGIVSGARSRIPVGRWYRSESNGCTRIRRPISSGGPAISVNN
jgi:hypothetical protein